MLERQIIPVTPLAQNCTLLWDKTTHAGCFIDPGGDLDTLKTAARTHDVRIESILLTHGHLDHAAGAGALAAHYDVPIYGPHADDLFLFESMPVQCLMYGFPTFQPFTPTVWFQDGQHIQVGSATLHVYHTPGHTPGHVVYHHQTSRVVWVGDVLFRGSVGRSDLPGGHAANLVRSICTKLWPLGREVTFVPGHGPLSTFGFERDTNPYVADSITGYRDP